jgi:polyisoprenoid-binding protein YceI
MVHLDRHLACSCVEGGSIYARRVDIPRGSHQFGPGNATLCVHTRRGGAAAKAGHDLELAVTRWEATLVVGQDPGTSHAELTADATSLRVQKGTGGMQALGEDDTANIHQTIDDEVLRRQDIVFRSTRMQGSGNRLTVEGQLTLAGATQPIRFELEAGADGAIAGTAVVTQTRWGMKPYSALFGALKVLDDVEVALAGHLEQPV